MAENVSYKALWTWGGIVLVGLLVLGAAVYANDDWRDAFTFADREEEGEIIDDEEEEQEDEPTLLSFTTLAKSTMGGPDVRAMSTIRSEAELDAGLRDMESPPSLSVDFSSSMVLAVFSGAKPTGGYDIEIKSITKENGKLTVTLEETSPGSDCVVTQVITSPYHFVILQKQQEDVSFVVRYETKDCS